MTSFRRPELEDLRDVVSFWRAAGPARWFRNDAAFDAQVRRRLGTPHEWAATGALDNYAGDATGALALLILLDQAPRNMFRGTPEAFATDAHARLIARMAIAAGLDKRVPRIMRGFFYLPFMHSEDLADQELCVRLYREAGDAGGLRWADLHRDIIARFGRFPHRNPILGRAAKPEEERFLEEGGFGG
jgi:uncharacterized protein (DUF924 family)